MPEPIFVSDSAVPPRPMIPLCVAAAWLFAPKISEPVPVTFPVPFKASNVSVPPPKTNVAGAVIVKSVRLLIRSMTPTPTSE